MTQLAGDLILRRLLDRAENAHVRQDDKPIRLLATKSGMPEYVGLRGSSEIDAFFGVLKQAEQCGAIRIEWDHSAGLGNAITRIDLIEPNALAAFLGVVPHWEHMGRARTLLDNHGSRFPGVQRFLDAWSSKRTCRRLGPDCAQIVLDGLKVLEARQDLTEQEVTLRELSVTLFSDSKYLATLGPVLDELLGDEFGDQSDVFERLGIVHFPQPVLIAGSLTVPFGNISIQPYLGLAPETLMTASLHSSVKTVLSVENLTTFHVLARDAQRPPDVLVLYTAGNPTPAFLQCYAHLLSTSQAKLDVFHWGDIDLGGIRIAYRLHAAAQTVSSSVRPLLMDARAYSQMKARRKDLTAREVQMMQLLCKKMGWMDVARDIAVDPRALEQEGLHLNWEDMPRDD